MTIDTRNTAHAINELAANTVLYALTPAMRDKLAQYINVHDEWFGDPGKVREECRSYAAEFVNMVINELGAPPTHEQYMAHKTGGPTPSDIVMANALMKLQEVQS